MTAVLLFCDSRLRVPGEWFNRVGDIVFEDLTKSQQRKFRHQTMGFSEANLPTVAAEQEIFELVNFGGVSQGESDL